MKRFASLVPVPLLLVATLLARADNATQADLTALKQAFDEDNRRLTMTLEGMQTQNDKLERQLRSLADEISKLRAENGSLREAQSRTPQNLVTREQLNQVVDQIKEVERHRGDDRKLFLDELDKLGKSIASIAADPGPHAAPKSGTKNGGKSNDKGADKGNDKSATGDKSANRSSQPDATTPPVTEHFVHEVQAKETLGEIITAYNKEHGMKVKQSDVFAANPKLKNDARKLYAGQKLIIPVIK